MAQMQDGWSLQKDASGIKVYTKEAGDSGYKPFKATVLLDNTVEEFASVMYDVDGLLDWGYKIKTAWLFERSGDSLQIYYAEAKAPFPYKNRDGIYKNVFQWNSKTKTLLVKINLLENYKVVDPDLVAIKGHGYWSATQLNSGKLEVTFMMEVNPGGEIPAWMANMVVDDSPYYTLLNLREAINKPKYKNKKYSFIK
ncbi:cyclase [Bizionia arctica]|uniref:Cyclase n=2 Tax=Bizionia arctica TaxID=1495645 RepID=A0A917GVQ2_9FLAO|nr:cyclase [Bizionia arctica]